MKLCRLNAATTLHASTSLVLSHHAIPLCLNGTTCSTSVLYWQRGGCLQTYAKLQKDIHSIVMVWSLVMMIPIPPNTIQYHPIPDAAIIHSSLVIILPHLTRTVTLSCFRVFSDSYRLILNNNNNNPICKAPECQKTSVALADRNSRAN